METNKQNKLRLFFFFSPENQFTSTQLWESRQILREKALDLVFEKCERRNSGNDRTSEVLENDATREIARSKLLVITGIEPLAAFLKLLFTVLSQEWEFIEGSKIMEMV